MANENPNSTPETNQPELEGGTYEIIRDRLLKQSGELRTRLDALNEARKSVFGSIETALVATERVTTDNNCIPRDMVPLGKRFVFGYNVHMGLKTETAVTDVLSVYHYQPSDHSFHREEATFAKDEAFLADFKNLYKYYRDTQFTKFARIGNFLYMVFQIGKSETDIKAFKWAVKGEELSYIDNRSDHEVRFPDQHEFRWVRTTRDMHRSGLHGHISIEDKVFVETIGGDLTIKVEDNTDTGKGIYAEAVDNADQTLDDAEIYYAVVGNLIILKIRPYQESDFRYIVFNAKLQTAIRIDALEDSCVLLPDDHGIIFANGYYLQTGEFKLFDTQRENMLFERRVTAPNGEDYLYVFYNRSSGMYVLLSYNLIAQQVGTPIACHGFSVFANGELCFFKGEDEPQKHHTIQVWQTPYLDANTAAAADAGASDSYLFKIGNKEIVRAMAECGEVQTLINKEDTYANLYLDILKASNDIIDSYHWLNRSEAQNLAEPLAGIKEAAAAAVDEFEKVVRIKKSTAAEVERVSEKADALLKKITNQRADSVDGFVKYLAGLRELRGEVISLNDLRYIDTALVTKYEERLAEATEQTSHHTVEYLLQENALQPYRDRVAELRASIDTLAKVVEANAVEDEIVAVSGELEMLIDVVSNLKIEDATHTTRIIDSISAIYSSFNQVNAALRKKRKELLGSEGKAEFNAQLKLISQSVVNYLDICDTPEKTEEYLNKLMVQLEELEGRFAEFDEFVATLTEKREEIYEAFESKKLSLVEARNRKAGSIMSSAERILKGIKNRVSGFETNAEINGYFASDLMVDKVRDSIKRLRELDDSVKADDLQGRLKTIREDALRQLKDRNELYVAGENMLRFGKHVFSVNTRPLDLTMVARDGGMAFHLTGTNFFEPVTDEAFLAGRELWQQELISENDAVYRAEYLAYQLLNAALSRTDNVPEVPELATKTVGELVPLVQAFMATRYNEGYAKGVHDADAAILLEALVKLYQAADLLRYPSNARACAQLFWNLFEQDNSKAHINNRLKGVGAILELFPDTREFADVIGDLEQEIAAFAADHKLFGEEVAGTAADYLFHELTRGNQFVIDREAGELYEAFIAYLKKQNFRKRFDESIEALKHDRVAQFRLAVRWLRAFSETLNEPHMADYIEETASLLLTGSDNKYRVVNTSLRQTLEGFQGNHAQVEGGKYELSYNHFMLKLGRFVQHTVPAWRAYMEAKKRLIDNYRDELRLGEFMPRVLTSFVRNKLIDEVYLPIIGDNLAKQIGSSGENKRTDNMGMLLLISPPGYGKTTLMEYVANRLGIVFMKVNGPAIGHHVTSLDPAEAPNAAAREELEKLNLGFEMGDNVMVYLDDIQHCNPEFLQKFISLCDAQRKIEGVYKGRSKTYDLRGKKVCVVMAGNPYTESGEKFRIPDMLANRADIYNLGDILGDKAAVFKLSYIENSLTSNEMLSRLANKSMNDVYTIVKMAETGTREGLEFEASHSAEELNEYANLLKKLLWVRDIILRVNQEYIYSAGQSDDYRTEPAFKLQGSYRNINKIAERLSPVMNQQELETLVLSYYENESQTLTTGAEANLLKFREMVGWLNETERKRWETIKAEYMRNRKLRGLGANQQMGQALEQLQAISSGLSGIKTVLLKASGSEGETPAESDA